mgnify:CR=1 FL=1
MALGINPIFGAPGMTAQMMGGMADQSMGAYLNSLGQMPNILNSAAGSAAAQINQAQMMRNEVIQRAQMAARQRADQQSQQLAAMMMGIAKQQQDAQQTWAALQQHALLSSLERGSRERMNTQDNATRTAMNAEDINARREMAAQEQSANDPVTYAQQLMRDAGYGDMGVADALGSVTNSPSYRAAFLAKFPHAATAAKSPTDHFNGLALRAIQGDAEARKQLAAAQADPVLAPMMPGYSDKEQDRNTPPEKQARDARMAGFAHTYTTAAADPKTQKAIQSQFVSWANGLWPTLDETAKKDILTWGTTMLDVPATAIGAQAPQAAAPQDWNPNFSSLPMTIDTLMEGLGRGASNTAGWMTGTNPNWWHHGWSKPDPDTR